METKEQLIIKKLFKLASNQQKIIQKLAQTVATQSVDEAIVEYLKRAWTTAAVNAGVSPITSPHIEYTAGKNPTEETYTLYADGVPNDNAIRQKLINTFKTQVKSQKPELDGKLGIIFGKKPV